MSKKSFLKGAIFGALTGAFLTLLYAPKRGEEVRNDLIKALKKTKQSLDEKVEELKKAVGDTKGKGAGELEKLLTAAQKLEQDLTQEIKQLSRKGGAVSKIAKQKLNKLLKEVTSIAGELKEEILALGQEKNQRAKSTKSKKVIKLNVKS